MNVPKQVVVRQAQLQDVEEIQALSQRVYGQIMTGYSLAALRGQLNSFPEGQWVCLADDKIVGYCASIRVTETMAFQAHTWKEISGGGFGSTHRSDGEWLYGIEVFVDPECRGIRIGERLYRARRELCQALGLRGIVFGGRMPFLSKRLRKVGSPEAYLEAVRQRKLRDPVVSFQLRQGFDPIGVLPGYIESDSESAGYAAHMVWRNPVYSEIQSSSSAPLRRFNDRVRVATVQYQQRLIHDFSEFERIVTYFVDVVADYRSDFVIFPELFTLQLLSLENEPVPADRAVERLTDYTDRLRELFRDLAVKYHVNIVAGSHPTRSADGRLLNISMVCLRDGTVHEQAKLHPTPDERYWWRIEGGDRLDLIQTDCGPIGVLICYDSEFPELARHLADQGALMLFVPFCTSERQGYLRVRYCCQARAVENQLYVVLSGNVGNLPRVHNMDIQYAQSCILTPCDFPFARDGVAADTTPNCETVAFADLNLSVLRQARQSGTVRNLQDRRHDLYSVVWGRR